jgi:hypothetical protein
MVDNALGENRTANSDRQAMVVSPAQDLIDRLESVMSG